MSAQWQSLWGLEHNMSQNKLSTTLPQTSSRAKAFNIHTCTQIRDPSSPSLLSFPMKTFPFCFCRNSWFLLSFPFPVPLPHFDTPVCSPCDKPVPPCSPSPDHPSHCSQRVLFKSQVGGVPCAGELSLCHDFWRGGWAVCVCWLSSYARHSLEQGIQEDCLTASPTPVLLPAPYGTATLLSPAVVAMSCSGCWKVINHSVLLALMKNSPHSTPMIRTVFNFTISWSWSFLPETVWFVAITG